MSPTPWRVPELWAMAISGVLVALWIEHSWPYWGIPIGLYGAACLAAGRQVERDRRVHQHIRAALRSKPIAGTRPATNPQLRRMHRDDLPQIPPADPR